jgi:hypothetical protein
LDVSSHELLTKVAVTTNADEQRTMPTAPAAQPAEFSRMSQNANARAVMFAVMAP